MYRPKKTAILISLLTLILSASVQAQYTGLRFQGHEVPLNQRTELYLTPKAPLTLSPSFEMSFDLKFEPRKQSYFGYIFRAILDGVNYDFMYSPQSVGSRNFHLVIGDHISGISFHYPLEEITEKWTRVQFKIHGEEGYVELKIGDLSFIEEIAPRDKKSSLSLFFGAHRYERYISTDLPAMDIRSIMLVQNGKPTHHWPLDHFEGEEAKEVLGRKNALVRNPVWISHKHSTWNQMKSIKFEGRITQGFRSANSSLSILSTDSLYEYDLEGQVLRPVWPNACCEPHSLFHLVTDPVSEEQFVYSLDKRMKLSLGYQGGPKEKIRATGSSTNTNFWHHNKIINPGNQVLFTFGGYGQLQYLNSVYRFNDFRGEWDTLDYQGTFHPRYLAGMGFNARDHKAYILGGYGSVSGKQEISPGYYYELLSYSFRENSFQTIAEFPDESADFCFSNSLYIDTLENMLYGLSFSKFEATPELQLLAVSLEDHSIQELGNSIKFNFLDINSSIDLYYDLNGGRLLAVTGYYEAPSTELSFYEIAYPPIAHIPERTKAGEGASKAWAPYFRWVALVLGIIVLMLILRWSIKRKARPAPVTEDEASSSSPEWNHELEGSLSVVDPVRIQPGSVNIFGGFQVISKEGKDITGSFTPLLKELFLYILLSSLRSNKGVSSVKLNEIFWFDKSEQSARNNRAVNIAKLRTILEEVGDCQITKETGYWKFFFDPGQVYVDYYRYLELVKQKNWSKEHLLSILSIVQKGPALSNINADWMDEFKSDISNEVIDQVLAYVDKKGVEQDAEFFIQLSNCVFHFDLANERAMIIKCRALVALGKHSLAKSSFVKFQKEYGLLYGEEYSNSFTQILDEGFKARF